MTALLKRLGSFFSSSNAPRLGRSDRHRDEAPSLVSPRRTSRLFFSCPPMRDVDLACPPKSVDARVGPGRIVPALDLPCRGRGEEARPPPPPDRARPPPRKNRRDASSHHRRHGLRASTPRRSRTSLPTRFPHRGPPWKIASLLFRAPTGEIPFEAGFLRSCVTSTPNTTWSCPAIRAPFFFFFFSFFFFLPFPALFFFPLFFFRLVFALIFLRPRKTVEEPPRELPSDEVGDPSGCGAVRISRIEALRAARRTVTGPPASSSAFPRAGCGGAASSGPRARFCVLSKSSPPVPRRLRSRVAW